MFLTHNPFSDHGPSNKVLSEALKYHIPEDIPANERTAFHGAAAAAAKQGKKNFQFGGKTHPVTMKKDTAKSIPTEALDKKDVKTVKGVIKGLKKAVATHSGQVKTLTKDIKDDVKKESTMTFREKLVALYEGDRAAHYKGATEPEPMHMKSMSSKGAMDMLNTPKSTEADGFKAAKDTAANIKKSAPGKKLRRADKNTGDLAIKPSATPVKDPSAKMQTAESTVNEDQAYHKKMATVHNDHGGAHERESTNGGSSDHDFASDHHHEAAKMHKAAADAHKKHGGDSKQYKTAAAEAHKATGEAHETAKDAGKIKNVQPSMMKFPNKPSMKKEDYGIAGNKVSSTLLDAINQVTKEGSIKGSGTDRKAVLKKAFRAGEDDTRRFYSGKKPTVKPPKGMRDLKKFDAKHKDKGIQKAFAGGRAAGDGDETIKGKARMKPQSNLPLNKYQRQGIKINKKDKADTAAYLARTKGK